MRLCGSCQSRRELRSLSGWRSTNSYLSMLSELVATHHRQTFARSVDVEVKALLMLYENVMGLNELDNRCALITKLTTSLSWQCPLLGWVKANCDGTQQHNDEMVTAGGVLWDVHGSIFITELWVVHDTLCHACRRDYKRVILKTNNKEVVRALCHTDQLMSRCALHESTHDLLFHGWEVEIKLIRCQLNKVVDWLAAQSRGGPIGEKVFITPSSGVASLP
ncbi:hypothetical protein V6N12_059440 [Hibiscus sabdariffa]|uniref:RNase H type-1 domain-containing protein n=1 Tax=Hibiscus sabdariffa TaxID=183260 RepID=A0ABR2EX63_9ROSI